MMCNLLQTLPSILNPRHVETKQKKVNNNCVSQHHNDCVFSFGNRFETFLKATFLWIIADYLANQGAFILP